MTSDKARELGLTPLARVRTAVLAGDDPVIMLTAPIPATLKALKKSGLSVGDIGASGARLMTALVHHMTAEGIHYGLQTMCEGGGMANATIIERIA